MAGRGGRQVFVRYEDGTTKKPRFMKARGIASIDVGGVY